MTFPYIPLTYSLDEEYYPKSQNVCYCNPNNTLQSLYMTHPFTLHIIDPQIAVNDKLKIIATILQDGLIEVNLYLYVTV